MLDELRQGSLPVFLIVIVELAELLRVHPELAGHLDVRVRQVVALSCLDPEPGRRHVEAILYQIRYGMIG